MYPHPIHFRYLVIPVRLPTRCRPPFKCWYNNPIVSEISSGSVSRRYTSNNRALTEMWIKICTLFPGPRKVSFLYFEHHLVQITTILEDKMHFEHTHAVLCLPEIHPHSSRCSLLCSSYGFNRQQLKQCRKEWKHWQRRVQALGHPTYPVMLFFVPQIQVDRALLSSTCILCGTARGRINLLSQ